MIVKEFQIKFTYLFFASKMDLNNAQQSMSVLFATTVCCDKIHDKRKMVKRYRV